jgi:hypothetical protein
VKPKVILFGQREQGRWGERGKRAMTFEEVVELIHDLQNALFDLRSAERTVGGTYYLTLVD